MAAVPAENVGPPDHAGGGPPGDLELPDAVPTDAAAWDVHASKHAEDLSVTITESNGQLMLRIGDAYNHGGREVAVNASTLATATGERPALANGVHSSGDTWTSPISYEDGMAVFEVPKFSTNDVTFSGTLEISATPAEDGDTFTYDVSDQDSVSNYSIRLTGSTATRWDNETTTDLANEAMSSISVAGNLAPTGPEGSSPRVELTGQSPTRAWSYSDGARVVDVDVRNGYAYSVGDNGTVRKVHESNGSTVWSYNLGAEGYAVAAEETNYVYVGGDTNVTKLTPDGTKKWEFTTPTSNIEDIELFAGGLYVATGNEKTLYKLNSDGTEAWNTSVPGAIDAIETVGETVYVGSADATVSKYDSTGSRQWAYDGYPNGIVGLGANSDYVYAGGGGGDIHKVSATDGSFEENWSIHSGEIIESIDVGPAGNVYSAAHDDNVKKTTSSGSVGWVYRGHGHDVNDVDVTSDRRVYTASTDWSVHRVNAGSWDPSFDLNADGTPEASYSGFLGGSETEAYALSELTTNDSSFSVSTTNGSKVDVSLEVRERTQTEDVTISVNSNETSMSGSLTDGETATLSTDESWVTEGTNNVSVSVTPGVSSDAPAPRAGLEYAHRMVDSKSVNYASETYSERYNVSKTWAHDAQDATLTIPFDGDVVDIRALERQTNGSTWETIPESNYRLNQTTLTVELGDVQKGTSIDIRTIGSKVRVDNGAISVTNPTVLGESLSSKITIEEYSDGFAIDVGDTIYNDELHYTHSESWSNPQAFARVQSDGTQEIRMPKAAAGATTRLSTIDLGVSPAGGHADVRIESAADEPRFNVRETTTADQIKFEWRETTSGHTYQLYSLDADVERDRGTASSPVTLTQDGTAERLVIYDLGSSGGGGGGGGAPIQQSSSGGPLSGAPGLILVIAVVLGGFYALSRRYGDSSISAMTVLGIGSVLIGGIALQSLAPRLWAAALADAIGNAFPLILIGGLGVLYLWYRARSAPDEVVNLQLGNK
jgi:hypothetical protein